MYLWASASASEPVGLGPSASRNAACPASPTLPDEIHPMRSPFESREVALRRVAVSSFATGALLRPPRRSHPLRLSVRLREGGGSHPARASRRR